MPRKAKDYSKGLIYKLCCKDTSITEIYVGSTTNFTKRKSNHKSSYNNNNSYEYNKKAYNFIRENGGWENWNMVLIEFYPCDNELELGRREDYFMNELKASLNSYTPHIYEDSKERSKGYYQANKEEIKEKTKEYQKEWKQANPEYNKGYYQENKEHIKEKTKEYQKANKQQIAERESKYYQANKEKILERIKQKYTCDCGSVICKGDKSKHFKSKKHLAYIEQK